MIPSPSRPRSALPGWSMAALALALSLTGAARASVRESWDAVYLGGAKIGHIHTWVEKVKDKGRDYNRVRLDIEMRLKRQDDETVIKLMYGTIETLDGEVLRLDTRTQAGASQDIRVRGDVINHEMKLIIDSGGNSDSRVIPWGPEVRGPYGAEESLARRPMNPHEKRSIRIFMPDLNKIADEVLEARAIEPVIMGDGSKRNLLRVDLTASVEGKRRPEYDARYYVDNEGQILKTESDVMGGMVYYRTSRKAALAPAGPVKFDMILSSIIKVPRPIPNPDQTKHVRYRISLRRSNPAEVFPTDARQSISPEKGGSGSAILEIKSVGPLDGEPVTGEVDPQYLRANALVNSDDARVRSLATRVTRSLVDPWEKTRAINRWVHQNIRDKNFKVAFANAAQVARDPQGDCTEHAVLAAAMCRAAGVPSRVAVGLIYVDDAQKQGFGFHMWVEVLVNHRWVAIDPSWDQAPTDAVHIKLSDTSLEGVAPFDAFLPVATVEGQLTIEPIEIR